MKMKKNVLTEEEEGKGYCDFVFDLSNLNELFEINIFEICLEMFFYFFFFYNFYFIFLFLFIDNGISTKREMVFFNVFVLRINQDF